MAPLKTLGLAALQKIDDKSGSSRSGSCGLIKWCYSMSHFASLPYMVGLAELLVLSNDPQSVASLCKPVNDAKLRILPLDETLRPLIGNWSLMLRGTLSSRLKWPQLLSLKAFYKLQLFSLVEYRAVLFTDVDVTATSNTKPASLLSLRVHCGLTNVAFRSRTYISG